MAPPGRKLRDGLRDGQRDGARSVRRASDFAQLVDVSQIVAAAIERYHDRKWYRRLWREIRGRPEPKKVPGLKW